LDNEQAKSKSENPGPATSAEEFIAHLERTFFANAGQSSAARRTALAEAISAATEKLGPEEARILIGEAKRRLAGDVALAPADSPVSSERLEKLTAENQELKSRLAELSGELGLRSAAYDHLADLSDHFLGDGSRLEKEEQIERFCHRIKNSFGILLSAFKDLLKGRKRFQMEYAMYFGMGKSMEGTRIIRTGEDKDVGRKFFEWDTFENVEESAAEMERALDELKYHQLAFLSGYKRSVKEGTLNVMRRLSPAELERELAHRKISLGPFSIPYRLLPWKRVLLYNELRRRYEDLAREDVQFFEAKFRSAFTSGYVEVMNRKAKAQQKR